MSSFLYLFAGEGILPYLPTLMEKLLLALSPSTVSINFASQNVKPLICMLFNHDIKRAYFFTAHFSSLSFFCKSLLTSSAGV